MDDMTPRVNPSEKKKVEKIISGNAKVKKKSSVAKFADNFISEDINNVKSYVISDVLIPTIKKAISEIVTSGIDMLLYGSAGNTKRTSSSDRISYRSYYDKREDRRDRINERRYRPGDSGYCYDDIILDTRGEAEEVLSRMDELIDTYGIVSVADLFDLVGITGNYTDNKYGWKNISNAKAIRVRDGYILSLPKAIPIV